MPLCPPPRLRESLPFFSRRRALRRIAYAVALGAVLVLPTALHRGGGHRAPLAVVTAPATSEDGTADLGTDDFMLSAGKLPEKFPEGWRKPPCPKAKDVTKIKGACFMILRSAPPCDLGYDDGAKRCVFPIAERRDAPNTIGR